MATLKIIEYPNPILSKKSKEVGRLSKEDLRSIQDMIETMYQEDGVGLAAPQVGISKRMIVVSPNAKPGEERVFINPEIVESSRDEELGLEGCLSVPGISCEIRRAKKIKLQAFDIKGLKLIEEFQNFTARVIQHEIDHLNGILLIDRVSFNERQTLLSSQRRL